MKQLIILSLVILGIFTKAQGIEFEERTFAEVLAKAKKENKLVFIDAYTSWCAPCKMMAKKVFPLQSVGDLYNSKFVNVKIDMEKGEGIALAKKYFVQTYPTYLFLDGNGELVHRSGSYLSEEEFLQVGKDAIDPSKQISSLQSRFEKGEKDPAFLKTAIVSFLRSSNVDLAEKAMDEYFKQNELTMEGLIFISTVLNLNPQGKYYDFYVDRKNDILKFMNPEQYQAFLENYQINRIRSKSVDKNTGEIKEDLFVKEAQKYFDKNTALLKLKQYKANDAFYKKDYASYKKLVSEITKDLSKLSASELNSIAWNFYQIADDEASLKKAIVWAKESVNKKMGYYNTDTLANLYSKTGDKENAKKWAEKAIELAKSSGQDATSTEELLKSL